MAIEIGTTNNNQTEIPTGQDLSKVVDSTPHQIEWTNRYLVPILLLIVILLARGVIKSTDSSDAQVVSSLDQAGVAALLATLGDVDSLPTTEAIEKEIQAVSILNLAELDNFGHYLIEVDNFELGTIKINGWILATCVIHEYDSDGPNKRIVSFRILLGGKIVDIPLHKVNSLFPVDDLLSTTAE